MKNIDLQLGGHPFTNDTIKFITESIRDVEQLGAGGWMSAFDRTNRRTIIIRGVYENPSDPPNGVFGGIVWYRATDGINDGEFLEVDPLPATPNRADWDYYVVETTDPAIDPVIYENGDTNNIHLKRRLVAKDRIVEGVSGVIEVDTLVNNNYDHRLEWVIQDWFFNGFFNQGFKDNLFNEILTNISSVDYKNAIHGVWSNSNLAITTGSEFHPVQHNTLNNRVKWRGTIRIQTVTLDGRQLVQMGAAQRPQHEKTFSTYVNLGGTNHFIGLKVTSAGGIYIVDPNGLSFNDDIVEIGCIEYTIDDN